MRGLETDTAFIKTTLREVRAGLAAQKQRLADIASLKEQAQKSNVDKATVERLRREAGILMNDYKAYEIVLKKEHESQQAAE
ncbi:hypothetical protein EMMF5_000727 [Cystobasidiomycetes sp. EMM_F5]